MNVRRLPRSLLIAATIVAIGVVAALDRTLPPEASLVAFYALPIVGITWYTSRTVGLTMAVVAVGATTSVQLTRNHTLVLVLWNGLSRFAVYVALVIMVSQVRTLLTRTRWLADIDPLTNLLNRRAFIREFEHHLRQERRADTEVSIAFIDIDHLKTINDTGGHDAGDAVIQRVAVAIEGASRKGDLLARIGGDEFVVCLIDSDGPAADAYARRLIETLKNGTDGNSDSVSIGIITARTDSTDAETLLSTADRLMYQAKQAGRGMVTSLVNNPGTECP